MADITKFFDKAYENQDFTQLADAPVSAIAGISEADAAALKNALGINTIRDLATNKFVRWSQAVVAFSNTSKN